MSPEVTAAWIGIAGVSIGAVLAFGAQAAARKWARDDAQKTTAAGRCDELVTAVNAYTSTWSKLRGSVERSHAGQPPSPLLSVEQLGLQLMADQVEVGGAAARCARACPTEMLVAIFAVRDEVNTAFPKVVDLSLNGGDVASDLQAKLIDLINASRKHLS